MNLFEQPPMGRKVGEVKEPSSPGFWLVSDSLGRTMVVASGESWKKGDQVAIIGGQIVGRAGRVAATKTYEV